MNRNLLDGELCTLRELEPSDLEILYNWENDTSIWEISDTLSPISKYILKRYLDNCHKDIFETKQQRFIIELLESHIPIGTIDLFDFDHFHKRAAVGILIAEKENRRKGYAMDSLKIIENFCFLVLRLEQLYCTISAKNTSSLKLFEAAGYKITGTRKHWRWDGYNWQDEYFLQLIK